MTDLIELKEVARLLLQSPLTIRRRMTDPRHPEYMPNIKVGRKRFMRTEDLNDWLDERRRENKNGER